tara:strand:+ start:110296 stop:110442 length:147 start_codon:yes stop_codon:yes gene_type:complete
MEKQDGLEFIRWLNTASAIIPNIENKTLGELKHMFEELKNTNFDNKTY